jgi:hypothetical protein
MKMAATTNCVASRETLSGSEPSLSPFRAENSEGRRQPQVSGKENEAPSQVPNVLDSMFKTSPETEEPGLLTAKVSSLLLQLPANSKRLISSYTVDNHNIDDSNKPPLQKQQADSYLSGPSQIDDRRFLPSYGRVVTPETISMYEIPSQKLIRSHMNDDAGYRKHVMAMEQNFQMSNTLSYHRSYASLKSQPEPSLLQRPRSPFPYPTRLKRLGFRPSSPALTDGGVVDYRRRAEIDRPSTVSIPLSCTYFVWFRAGTRHTGILSAYVNGSYLIA